MRPALLKLAIGKTVASVETRMVDFATYGGQTNVIDAIVFTDGSRITFRATEIEYGDPVPQAVYHSARRRHR